VLHIGRFSASLGPILGLAFLGCSGSSATLVVDRTGSAPGLVTSDPAGINCGTTCKATFSGGTSVTLTAMPVAGALFTGWSGDCTGGGPCVVEMKGNKHVVAGFGRGFPLTVTTMGSGSVVSMPDGIDCGTTCSATLLQGTVLTLTAKPVDGWTFTGWGGACSGTAPCKVTLTMATSVTAKFVQLQTLTVMKSGVGTVTSMPAGIDCGSTCTTTFLNGTDVRLTAAPGPGWVLAGWTGACTGNGPCTVSMTDARMVSAAFVPTLAVTVTKMGMGTVTSSPAGINCGATCMASFQSGTMLTLMATPQMGWVFTGWGGACSGTGPCAVPVEAAVNVEATFAAAATIAVKRAGAGMGVVTSMPAGISCDPMCSTMVPIGTKLTLTAKAADGSVFTGWSGACMGTAACELTADAMKSVTATFEPLDTLTVMTAGKGKGKVTSMPAGIDCGATCMASYARGSAITLTPMADATSAFTGWMGACTGTGKCVVTLDAAKMVTASFEPAVQLTVTTGGTGMGQVTSSPAGIDCGMNCTGIFASGTVVTLTATAAMGSVFTAWSGACTGAGTCVVTLDAAKSVKATFEASYDLTITKAGPGMGTVTSVPAGINCGMMCSAKYSSGTVVTLTAAPGMGWVFGGWGGACTGLATTCMVTVDGAKKVTATFSQNFTVTVTKYGSGGVTSVPGGIDCGNTCSADFAGGTNVTLTATPAMKFVFSGWAGACSGTSTCTLTVDAAKSLSATFIPDVAFAAASSAAAGLRPMYIALGDLNGDGKLDLATSNNGADSVSVLLGDGAGAFGMPTDTMIGTAPMGIATGVLSPMTMMTPDTFRDVAAVSSTLNNVSVLINVAGDSTLVPTASPVAGMSPIAIAAAELNGDTNTDLVVASTLGSANVIVLLGKGDGTYQTGQGFAAGTTPQSVAVADVTGDGKLDLVVANMGSHDVSILPGNGNGTFQTATSMGAGMSPRSVAVADINLDGKADVVVADSAGNAVQVLLGNGNGTFQTAVAVPAGTGARGVAISDLDGDSRPDVVVANEGSSNVSVLLGSGTPALFIAPRQLTVAASPTSVVIGDLNADGKPDIVSGHGAGSSVSVLLQQ
jgi:hypothetical protein